MSKSLRTPLGRVRGLGASKEGVGHFIVQRVTAISNAILVTWLLISILLVAPHGYDAVTDWIARPLNALLIILAFASAANHMRIGMQVIIEDYIAKTGTRLFLLILNTFVAVLLFATAAFSVLRIAG